ncbi:DUF397 domain-containing protein [Actinorugispora endophytica]|uniref:Uncharacterized protein DUF397 n=1 Tax=Actinorugispora endophytica TaxID=1605990 RepID=A0A4V3D8X4_9ACTN|nr:DUF397 domain-containing protein [Actinorugispora endophytica]TDQ53570.1 uncharacterized protein DUF397 [Actinorugispora endophytica]
MAAFETESAQWRTSSYSGTGGGQCVEVADTPGAVGVRDSRAPQGVVLSFPADGWTAFLKATIHGGL